MIVVIEGIDKSGKTTQVNMLKDRLSKQFRVATLSFPDYNTRIGREIKSFLNGEVSYNARVRHLLLAANRWENRDKIEELNNKNDILILNRYYHSNIVYGLSDNLPLEWLLMLDQGLPKEDVTIVLDVDVDVMISRLGSKADLFENDIERMKRVVRLYRELSRRYNWILVDGNRSKEEVNDDIISMLHIYK